MSSRASALGPLQDLLADAHVSEVMVNGSGAVWVERAGTLFATESRLSAVEVEALIERVLGPLGRRVDRSSPFADGRLADGSRVHVVVPPVAIDGPHLTIRRFRPVDVVLEDFADAPIVDVLHNAIDDRRNLLVSGATSAGKTTLLNALAGRVDPGERIITIEDAAELRLRLPHVVRLEVRPANAEGAGAIDQRELVRNALRMRPDRLIVGEVRGGEAFDMVQAMNTGHDGSMSTCHANSVVDALRRIETMVLVAGSGLPLDAIRQQIGSSIDLVIHVERGDSGRRRVVDVARIDSSPTGWLARSLVGQTLPDDAGRLGR
ncbi:MAG TPA: ATPase, T2SS/T4P/T4SS family [Acidimicrobiales bacterium]|nr:ATPase, T2SS/T4P/T4SS family [Acidimicrobiales bacterium]